VHRLVAALAAFAFLASGSAALADGPSAYVSQGGLGALAPDGKTRYVAVFTGRATVIERVRVRGGSVQGWTTLEGFWGIPAPTFAAGGSEGLTRDGKRLIVSTAGRSLPTRFTVIDTRTFRVVDRFALNGNFAYDALSPDGSTLYLIQHVDGSNINRYVVRAYDLRNHTLAPDRIADKTQLGWVMEGSALTRATSGDGRWVYTLYQRPGGYPFIHALDTIRGVAHCTGLPWTGNQAALWNVRLSLRGNGSLAVHWKSGRPWLTINTANWQLTHVHPGSFPRAWVLAGAVGTIALVLVCAAALRRRRHGQRAILVSA
jgi:hypothetical protein